jgi:hypothetical protein
MWRYLFFLFFAIIGQEIHASEHRIEKKDRIILEPFFKVLLTKETLGYVLLGEKPVAWLTYLPKLSWEFPFRSLLRLKPYLSSNNQIMKKGWKTWEKYSSLRSNHFLFIEERSLYSSCAHWIFVINRDLFCKVVNEHCLEFERILGRKITGEALFERVKQEQALLKLLQNNDVLLGIILGFGKNNAQCFAEGDRKKLGFFPAASDKISSIQLPSFRANLNDPETMLLREKYLKCRDRIQAIFLDQNVIVDILPFLKEGDSYGVQLRTN